MAGTIGPLHSLEPSRQYSLIPVQRHHPTAVEEGVFLIHTLAESIECPSIIHPRQVAFFIVALGVAP
jgi:hypothetical protein